MLNSIYAALDEIRKEEPSIEGAALLHVNGLAIISIGYDESFWVKVSALLSSLKELSTALNSKPFGVDAVFESHYIVARSGKRVVAVLVAKPDADLERLDYLAFRLVEEVEEHLLGL
ncbi:MAG: hypothetical protein ABWK05_00395 [Pyrobaculum sp.]